MRSSMNRAERYRQFRQMQADRVLAAERSLAVGLDRQLLLDSPDDAIRPVWDGDQFIGGYTAATNRENTMPFKYSSRDADANVWPDGEYQAVLSAAEDTTSRNSGSDMLVLTYTVYGDAGEQKIKDYVVQSTLRKLRQLADAFGRRGDFDADVFDAADYVGQSLIVELGRDDSPGYDAKNKVVRVKAAPQKAVRSPTGSSPRPIVAHRASNAMPSPVSDVADIPASDIPF